MKKLYYLLLLVILPTFQAEGQQFSDRHDGANLPTEGKITGRIVDGSTSSAIEYASIGLYSMRDSSLVSGAVTDSLGRFSLTNLRYGRFYMDVKYMGYKKSRIKGILLTPNQKTVEMGAVKLESSSHVLDEVEVTGNRPPVEYKLDKKVVNVSQQITAQGGTAVDVLENVPSVQTDVEGNVTLRGSSSFTVLIDGKPSVLQGSDALQQLPASIIQQIEIITNPSAKYDPDGSAGIINVILKKQKITGITGVANLSMGTGNKYNGDFLINIKNEKFNYFVGGNFMDMSFHMKGTKDLELTPLDTTDIQKSDVRGTMHRTGKGIRAGFDYNITDRKTLSFSFSYNEHSFGRNMDSKNHEYFDPAGKDYDYLYNTDSYSPHKHYNASLDYFWKLDDKGQQVTATAYYSHGPSSENSDMAKIYTDSAWNPSGVQINQLTTSSATENEFRAKIDYSKPFGAAGKFEAGYQGRYEASNSDYHFFDVLPNTDPIEDFSQFNKANFMDHIESVYATVSDKMKLFEYQLGLRGEYTGRNLEKPLTGEKYPISRFDYFPSIHLSRDLPWNMQVMASYTRRINRPHDHDLDPFRSYVDSKTIRQGNPGLLPEFADSYEMSLQKRMGAGFISVEGYFRQTKNMISQITTPIYDTMSLQTSANFGRSYAAGAEAMVNMPLTKWWSINANGTVFKYHIDASAENSTEEQNSTGWNTRVNSTFKMNWGMQFQINYFYNGPSATPQGRREAFSFTSIGIKQEMLKKKASLTLQVRDIFGTGRFTNISSTSGLYQYFSMKREAPVVMLTFSYRINNYKQQPQRKNNDDSNESDFGGGNGGME